MFQTDDELTTELQQSMRQRFLTLNVKLVGVEPKDIDLKVSITGVL